MFEVAETEEDEGEEDEKRPCPGIGTDKVIPSAFCRNGDEIRIVN